MSRPFRSVLYIPASKPRAIEKARGLPVDAIIFDLEDAVAPDEKEGARATLVHELTQGGFGPRCCIARINGLDTPWGQDDLTAIAGVGPDAVLIPKVDGPGHVAAVSAVLDASDAAAATRIWAMMETPLGILNAGAIATAPRMQGLVLGTNDLAKDLKTRPDADRAPLVTSLSLCVLAARAAGIVVVDGVYNAFKDDVGLQRECDQGRDLGMDGKTLIHPAQVAITNAAFGPSQDDIDDAQRQIDAFEAALARGEGVAVLDGKIVENLHVETARATLAKAAAIAKLEQAA